MREACKKIISGVGIEGVINQRIGTGIGCIGLGSVGEYRTMLKLIFFLLTTDRLKLLRYCLHLHLHLEPEWMEVCLTRPYGL